MSYRILTLSPGSTSTKVAVFEGEKVLVKVNITHKQEELAQFEQAKDQLDYRVSTIMNVLTDAKITLDSVDAFSGYCGGMGPTVGGIFAIDENVVNRTLNCGMNHPAILGAPILFSLAQKVGKPAYAVNQPDTDEMQDVARITGYPGVYRKSHVHCLNQKEVAIRYAATLNKSYEDINVIVAHIGGGLSVAAHRQGKMIDTNDVLEGSGPFAPNRSGDVPLKPVISQCYSGAEKKDVLNIVGKTGGLKGLLGTDDAREIEDRIKCGDEWARLVYSAMAYQVAKAIGSFATVLAGKVDGIILTGGVSNDKTFVASISELVSWIAPVTAYGGDFEMEGSAAGALRALTGEEAVMTYTGIPNWTGFSYADAPQDLEG